MPCGRIRLASSLCQRRFAMAAKAARARVMVPAKHVHLHIAVDPETEVFQYKAIVSGERTTLHLGDSITFRSKDPFTIEFHDESPFTSSGPLFTAHRDSGEWIIPAQVRTNAALKHYPYLVRMTTLGRTYEHSGEEVRILENDPEI